MYFHLFTLLLTTPLVIIITVAITVEILATNFAFFLSLSLFAGKTNNLPISSFYP